MDVGYARIKKIDNTDPLNPVETYRYVDILIDNEADEVVEPYFFLYDYGQKERTLHYSVPLEGLNHTEVNQNTLEILGTQVPSVNKLLSYTNSIYFPQLHPSKFYIEEPIPHLKTIRNNGSNIRLITTPNILRSIGFTVSP
jgi:hypothetical protein